MARLSLLSAVTALLALPLSAQTAAVAPSGYDLLEGNSNNAYPWNQGSSSTRIQFIHDSSHFAAATGPVVISRLRYRADSTAGSWAGGSWPSVRIDMASATADFASASGTFSANLGPDLTTVHNGPLTVLPGTGNGQGVPGPWYIDIPLTTPFLYDPGLGNDLVVDVHLDGTGWSGISQQTDSVDANGNPPPLCTRVYNTSGLGSPTGTVGTNYGPVCEFTYQPSSGFAYSAPYGTGCIDAPAASFYELFTANTFDLSNTTLQFLPTGNGYVVLNGAPQWFTPTSAPLALSDDSVSPAQPLGFTLQYPGGSTNDVYVSSNGFVWAQSSTDHGCCNGTAQDLLSGGARWSPLWGDFNPASSGSVHFDTDPANGAAYVTFDQVVEYGTNNPNTFQVAFFNSGAVEIRFQSCTVTGHTTLTGWSPGTPSRDPGAIDISATAILITSPDMSPIRHAITDRPVIGTAVTLETTNVPQNGVVGATLFGLTEFNPGIDLTSIGMPGCYQYASIDASAIWIPAGGVGSTLFAIPNNPGLAGIEIKTQGVALVPGINTQGALSTNGLKLFVDVN